MRASRRCLSESFKHEEQALVVAAHSELLVHIGDLQPAPARSAQEPRHAVLQHAPSLRVEHRQQQRHLRAKHSLQLLRL